MKNCFSVVVAAAAAIALCGPAVSPAQSYPAKPVRMIISYAPGAASDIVSRTLATNAGASLGQALVPPTTQQRAARTIARPALLRMSPPTRTVSEPAKLVNWRTR